MKNYKINIGNLVDDYLEKRLSRDSVSTEEDKQYLRSLTQEEIEVIKYQVWDDQAIREYIDNTIRWFVYSKKRKEEKENENE